MARDKQLKFHVREVGWKEIGRAICKFLEYSDKTETVYIYQNPRYWKEMLVTSQQLTPQEVEQAIGTDWVNGLEADVDPKDAKREQEEYARFATQQVKAHDRK